MPSLVPTRKVGSSTVGVAIATLIAISLKHFANWDIGVEGLGALSVVTGFAVGYIVPNANEGD